MRNSQKHVALADESANITEAEIGPPFYYQWNWKHKKNLFAMFSEV